MPHTPSAKKRMRQYDKLRKYNRAYKKAIKESLKTFLTVVKTGTPEQVQTEFNAAVKKLDKAAARRVIASIAIHEMLQAATVFRAGHLRRKRLREAHHFTRFHQRHSAPDFVRSNQIKCAALILRAPALPCFLHVPSAF